MVVNRPEDIIFRTEDPSSDIVIAGVHVGPLYFLAGNMSRMPRIPFTTNIPTPLGNFLRLLQEV